MHKADTGRVVTDTSSSPGHGALRRYRTSLENRTYFITACTFQREPLLASTAAAEIVVDSLRALEPVAVHLLASVVMPDHIHCVFTLRESTLPNALKRFRGSSAQRLNAQQQRTGPVWQPGYFDRLLRFDDPLEQVLRYMWFNPATLGTHFRCAQSVWTWFRTCIEGARECPAWLSDSGAAMRVNRE